MTPPNGMPPQAVPAPPQAPHFLMDPSNPYISDYPAMLDAELVDSPKGQRLMLTFRVANTTLSVPLAKDDAMNWRDVISKKISEMNGLILPH
jgi:hypothetical protein